MAGWEYTDHPKFSDALLVERARRSLLLIRQNGASFALRTSQDTRSIHSAYFNDLTPDYAPYYAGHYRGENFEFLSGYNVVVAGVSGSPAQLVQSHMSTLSDQIRAAIASLDVNWSMSDESVHSKATLLARMVQVAAAIFVAFVSIHPYANGNGHTARIMLIAITGRYGYWHFKMPVHPGPGNEMNQAIADYRMGNRATLENYIRSSL